MRSAIEAAPAPTAPRWHGLSVAATLETLRTSTSGLTGEEARARLERDGPNAVRHESRTTAWRVFARQFTDFMILVLVVAAMVSAVVGDVADSIAIVAIVALNGFLGFSQELRAERALEALAAMAAPTAEVLREGGRSTIPATEMVIGDLAFLEAGTIVPADLRLIESHRLRADEAALTGESQPVDKHTSAIDGDDVALGDRTNLAFAGTHITYGRGLGVVVATGETTEFGRIAGLLASTIETEAPLARRLRRFGVRLAIAILILCAALFGVGLLRGEPPLVMFLTAVSLAVAAIPEALPAVVTINLALGAREMARRKAVVRRLSAIEALGSVTYICSDKTGTLTRNRMRAESLWLYGGISARPSDDVVPHSLLRAMVLCNDARANASGALVGDPTETALVAAARDASVEPDRLDAEFPRVAEAPFDSERMRMSTIHRAPAGEGFLVVTKGAAEAVLSRASQARTATGDRPLVREAVERASEEMAREGLRVLALAERRIPEIPEASETESVEQNLTFLGLVGLLDPPREEAYDAVRQCHEAGITPVMITGDHPATATAIARRLGILREDESAIAASEDAPRAGAYARVTPERKLAIVRSLQGDGEIVAMTGDGVNDAPALRQADVGVAMGITGTDVAKQASSIVVLDDDFATIVAAVREGRRIFDNIRRFVRYALTTNAGEILTVAAAPIVGLPIPLLPAQILFINLMTDGLPGVALAAEPAEHDVMRRPPNPPDESLFARGLGIHVVWVGCLIAAISLSLQAWAMRSGIAAWQTIVFVALASAQLWHVLAVRSETRSLLAQGLHTNLPLLASVVVTALVLVGTVYVPFLNEVLHTTPLSARELAIATLVPSIVCVAVEIEKRYRAAQPTNRSKPAQNRARTASVS